ncbi:S-layer family protein [Paenibacillus taihuensis]|uniref:S-layer family protein n=1 Tax=Paenibacillus taihuensis TaxID=1156355 RepID=A0A3D9SC58_9BACL|nr:S-layer homology domain-containing protein [Paenibacillus taihuensis]REE91484.1 S-layer family protein [Paenibacillus taihuensis]
MIKKLATWFILLALVIQFLPANRIETVQAATGNFTFPNESDQQAAPRITTDERITLTGTISNVDPTSIAYNVYQITDPGDTTITSDDKVGSQRENLTSNISISGSSIQIFNIQLFPGLNKITFTGTQGGGQVSNTIYVDYHNGPMLYDLTASLDGNSFPIVENGTTVVQSSTSRGKSTADISITGKAPNAQAVTIVVNGSSKTYSVNSANNNSFAAAPIRLNQGKNLVTIKIKNGTQTIETSRDIAFYNGSVTFYDVNINELAAGVVQQSAALEYNPNFVVSAANSFNITGSVIVPNSYVQRSGETVKTPHPDPAVALASITAALKEVLGGAQVTLGAIAPSVAMNSPKVTDDFFVYQFTIPLPSIATTYTAGALNWDLSYNLDLKAPNEVNKDTGTGSINEGTNGLFFSLRDATKPFVAEINYLPGYKPTGNYEAIQSVPLANANLYGIPVGIEVLVGNPSTTPANNTIIVDSISDLYGHTKTLTASDYTVKPVTAPLVTKTVNGKLQTFHRFIIEFTKLPYEGTQTITVHANTSGIISAPSASTFTMLYGPYVNYKTAFDTMAIDDDTTSTSRADDIIGGKLSDFEGELQNINDVSEIRYDTTGGPRTVYFYINNVPFEIVPVSTDPHDTHFKLKAYGAATTPATYYRNDVIKAMFSGENEIKFVFQGKKSSYEKIIKINLIPTNLPVIPVKGTTIYPFVFKDSDMTVTPKPIANDSHFPLEGSIYKTSEAFMNVYGTFDFIDLGQAGDLSAASGLVSLINTKLSSLGTSGVLDDYILKISSPSMKQDIVWDLSKPFEVVYGDTFVAAMNTGGTVNNNLIVRYDCSNQTFSFILKKQELNADGSSSVVIFSVYNSGLYGPKATYRIEVDPTVLPYKIIRPMLPEEGTINRNFFDFIINANGATKVTINKVAAVKSEYDGDNDSSNGIDYPNAFRTTISNLKPGVNKINFTIESGTDKVSNYIEIKYVPTNIPGAEYLETMKNSHKIFDGAISLTFPKGTSLIRRDYNVADKFKGQIYTDNKLLFAIANPEDGVVNRREYEVPPAGFDKILQSFGTRFKVSFPTRFSKSSPVFWIDAGLADDLSTNAYDPLQNGVDPYQYPNNHDGTNGKEIPTYDLRNDDEELIASKRGTLTLAFDPNIRQSAGTIVTVFRYDVKEKFWVNIGGVVDSKKNTITVPFEQFGYYVAAKMTYSFSDVTGHPYARNYMEASFAKGVMNAANFDDFGADMYTSRGEFTRMIVKAIDIPLNYELSKPHFDDVAPIINSDALWDYSYIETAAREGIVRGTQPRTFEPTSNISRQDAAVFLARALNLKLETDATKIDKALQKTFKDYNDINYYARAAVLAIAKKGFIQGSPVDNADPKKGMVFEPKSNLLRSDAAIIVDKMLIDMKRLPKIN